MKKIKIGLWRGKNIEELNKEELLKLVIHLIKEKEPKKSIEKELDETLGKKIEGCIIQNKFNLFINSFKYYILLLITKK